jgi:hypothetical protein
MSSGPVVLYLQKMRFFFREAIALAKVRLLPTDPLLLDLYSSWGRRLESEYCFEQASKW